MFGIFVQFPLWKNRNILIFDESYCMALLDGATKNKVPNYSGRSNR